MWIGGGVGTGWEGAGVGRKDGESKESDSWNWGSLGGQCRKLVQWKFPGIYEGYACDDF